METAYMISLGGFPWLCGRGGKHGRRGSACVKKAPEIKSEDEELAEKRKVEDLRKWREHLNARAEAKRAKDAELEALQRAAEEDARHEPLPASVAIAVSGRTSGSDQRRVMPSLLDLQGIRSSDFMLAAETWPDTRMNILETTRQILGDRFLAAGSRYVAHLSDWFAFLEVVGESSSFGTIMKGCIRTWDAENRKPLHPPRCVQYDLKLPGAGADGSRVAYSVSLIIKLLAAAPAQRYRNVPYAGHDAEFKTWTGETNSVREVMMGRLLNLLVIGYATPHLPLIYEPFYAAEIHSNGFAMELAHMSLANFITSKILMGVNDKTARELLDVTILQLCNGLLCAQKHYDFRHNDFHAQNAMMTFITDTTYNYRVHDAFYKIPNYGMCWKLLDFGSTSGAVFDRHDSAHSAMHSDTLHDIGSVFLVKDHAMEFFDLLFLVTSAGTFVKASKLPKARKAVLTASLDSYVTLMRSIALSSDRRGSLQAASAAHANNAARRTRELQHTTEKFSALMRSSGLLEIFFQRLGARFRVARQPGGVVFDADASPFAHGDIVLSGIHHDDIVVAQPLLAPSSSSSPSPSPSVLVSTPSDAIAASAIQVHIQESRPRFWKRKKSAAGPRPAPG